MFRSCSRSIRGEAAWARAQRASQRSFGPHGALAEGLRKRLKRLFFVCLALWSCPLLARAEPELALTWQAAEGCPDEAWARARVSARLGRPLDDRASATLFASATLTHAADRFVLALHTRQAESEGDRTLAAQACAELAEATVLVLALAIDPDAVARAETAAPAIAPSATPTAALDSERPPFLQPRRDPPPPARPAAASFWGVRADGLVPLGQVPSFTAGASLALGYSFGRLHAELSGFWLWPSDSGDRGSPRVRVSLWALRPTLCAALWGQAAALSICAAYELGRATGQGFGLPVRERNHLLWQAASLGPRLAVSLGKHLALVGELALLLPVNRPRFVSASVSGRETTQLYEAWPVAGRATLGLELRF